MPSVHNDASPFLNLPRAGCINGFRQDTASSRVAQEPVKTGFFAAANRSKIPASSFMQPLLDFVVLENFGRPDPTFI